MVSPKLAPWLSDYLKSAEQALGTNLSSAEYTGAYRDKKLMILHSPDSPESTDGSSPSQLVWATVTDGRHSICCKIKRDGAKSKQNHFLAIKHTSGSPVLVPGAILKLQSFRPVFTRVCETINGSPRQSSDNRIALELREVTVEQVDTGNLQGDLETVEGIEQVQTWQTELRKQDALGPVSSSTGEGNNAAKQQLPVIISRPNAMICAIVGELYASSTYAKAAFEDSVPQKKAFRDPLSLGETCTQELPPQTPTKPLDPPSSTSSLPQTPAKLRRRPITSSPEKEPAPSPKKPAVSRKKISAPSWPSLIGAAFPDNIPCQTSPPPEIPRRTPDNEYETILVSASDMSMSQSLSQSQPWSQPGVLSQALPASQSADQLKNQADDSVKKQAVAGDKSKVQEEARRTDDVRRSPSGKDQRVASNSDEGNALPAPKELGKSKESPGQHQPDAWSKPSFMGSAAKRRKQGGTGTLRDDSSTLPGLCTGIAHKAALSKDPPPRAPSSFIGSAKEDRLITYLISHNQASELTNAVRKRALTPDASSDEEVRSVLRPTKKQKLESEPGPSTKVALGSSTKETTGSSTKETVTNERQRSSTNRASAEPEARPSSRVDLQKRTAPQRKDGAVQRSERSLGKRKAEGESGGGDGRPSRKVSRVEDGDVVAVERRRQTVESAGRSEAESSGVKGTSKRKSEHEVGLNDNDPNLAAAQQPQSSSSSKSKAKRKIDHNIPAERATSERSSVRNPKSAAQSTSGRRNDPSLAQPSSSKLEGKQRTDAISVRHTSRKSAEQPPVPEQVEPRIQLEIPAPKHMLSWTSIQDILVCRILEKYQG